jgi:hypothetical protein
LVYWERGTNNWDLAHAGFLFVNVRLVFLFNASAWSEKCKLSDKFREQDTSKQLETKNMKALAKTARIRMLPFSCSNPGRGDSASVAVGAGFGRICG